jgi:hypothetical protein
MGKLEARRPLGRTPGIVVKLPASARDFSPRQWVKTSPWVYLASYSIMQFEHRRINQTEAQYTRTKTCLPKTKLKYIRVYILERKSSRGCTTVVCVFIRRRAGRDKTEWKNIRARKQRTARDERRWGLLLPSIVTFVTTTMISER